MCLWLAFADTEERAGPNSLRSPLGRCDRPINPAAPTMPGWKAALRRMAIFHQLANQWFVMLLHLSQALVALETELQVINFANNSPIGIPQPTTSVNVGWLTRATDVVTTLQDHLYCCDDDAPDN